MYYNWLNLVYLIICYCVSTNSEDGRRRVGLLLQVLDQQPDDMASDTAR